MRAFERKVKANERDPESFPTPIVQGFVQRDDAAECVHNIEQLVELFAETTHIIEETSYHGADHGEVLVLRAALPANYVARVPQIMVKHVPEAFFKRDQVVIQMMKSRNGQLGEKVILCRQLQPAWTTRSLVAFYTNSGGITTRFETPAEIMYENYHHITMKIRRSDGSLLNWIPGRDKQTGLCNELGDNFVRIGMR